MKKLLCYVMTFILLLSAIPIYANADSESLAAPTNIQVFCFNYNHDEESFNTNQDFPYFDVALKWSKVPGADGYQIKAGKNDFVNEGLTRTTNSNEIKKHWILMRWHDVASLRIRAFKLIDGKKVYGKYANIELQEPVNAKTQKVYKEGCLRYVIRFNKAYIINIVNCGKTLEIPEKLQGKTVEGIEMCKHTADFYDEKSSQNIEHIIIPKTLKYVGVCFFCSDDDYSDVSYGCEACSKSYAEKRHAKYYYDLNRPNLKKYTVKSGNKYFCSVNGVLMSKNKKQVISYPSGKTDKTYTLPLTTTEVLDGAFSDNKYLKKLIIPAAVKHVYYGQSINKNASVYFLNPDTRLYGHNLNHDNKTKNGFPFFYGTVNKIYGTTDSNAYKTYKKSDDDVTVKKLTAPKKSTSLKATKKKAEKKYTITLKWKKVKGADGYKIRVKDSKGKFKTLGYTSKLSFKATQAKNKNYKYYVKAYKKYDKGRLYGKNKTVKVKT